MRPKVVRARLQSFKLTPYLFILLHKMVHILQLGLESLIFLVDFIIVALSQFLFKLVLLKFKLVHLFMHFIDVDFVTALLEVISVHLFEPDAFLLAALGPICVLSVFVILCVFQLRL